MKNKITIGIVFLLLIQLLWSAPSFATDYYVHANTGDNQNSGLQPPAVSITEPGDGATVSGDVQISATASDNIGVTRVTFAVDGAWVGKDTSAPYAFNWDSSTHADGLAKLQAIAYDAAGNSSKYTLYVTANNQGPDTEKPGVVITGPGDGATVSGDVQISATASDNIGVTKVTFAVDGAWVGKDTSAPYAFNWDSSTHADGIAKLQAIAYDAAGNSRKRTLYVTANNQGPDTEKPGVVITGPGDGATVSGDVQISATASDNIGVTKVTFAVDGAWVGKDTSAPYAFNWDSSTHADGIAKLQAIAYDAAGNSRKRTLYVTANNQGSDTEASAGQGSGTGFQCYGCDDTNTKENDTISRYDNADGLYKAVSLWRIPWLEYDYIPQGIHVTEDGFAYMSMYHKDKDSVSSNSSVVVKYNIATNIVTDVYHLKNSNNSKYMGHVGGLVVSGDYFIVPDGSKLQFFQESDATPVYGIESEIKLAFTTSVDFGGSEYNYKMSFLSTTKDHRNQNILWTGQFSTSTSVGSDILGYKIESDGSVNPTPIYRLYVPETVNKLQGVTVLNASYATYTLLVSQSYGNNTSYIYKLNYNRQWTSPYKYDYASKSVAFKGPAGLEDLHASADGIWSLSESGANYYQNRTSGPWSQLFPFVIKLKTSDI